MKRVSVSYLLILLGLIFGGSGCQERDPQALQEVHWDRDMCMRCKMVVSERHHAVQVINIDTGRSYMFDDIGCVILWFDDEKTPWASRAKIWITDVQTGEWIDARNAYYSSGTLTPMAYGFSAHKQKLPHTVSFQEMSQQIFIIEEKNNRRAY